MIAVSKSELKTHMLDYFRKIEETGEELVVTSHRRPVLKVTRLLDKRSAEEVFKDTRGKARLPDEVVLAPEPDEWGDSL